MLRRDALRWGLCFAVAAGVHGGAALALLYTPPDSDSGFVAGAAVMMVDLAEAPAATTAPPTPLPPGPEQDQVEATPPPMETKPPEQVTEDLPKEETKPPDQMAEVALPQPEPPKPEEPKPEAPAQEQQQAMAPPPSMAVPSAAPPTAGVETPQPPSPAVLRWQSRLSAQIGKAKRYPSKADARRERGTATVTFRIDDNGRVVESRILESSSWPHLDEEALLIVARAQPYPKPPANTKPEDHWIIFPLVFELPK
jgi:protein TonB